VYGINDLEHTCDEYLVLLAKSGMTTSNYPSQSILSRIKFSVLETVNSDDHRCPHDEHLATQLELCITEEVRCAVN
jgi:hypothetical protein